MKTLSNLRNRLRQNILNNKRGQGATEYILLLVVVVGLVIAFGPMIKSKMGAKMGELSGAIDEVKQ